MAAERIVILGGGFAGVKCARTLRKLLETDHEIVLFNRENHMVFHPLLAEVAGATLQPKDVAAPLRQLLNGISCRTEEVLAANLEAKRVEFEAHDGVRRSLPYDHLVIACGNVSNIGIVPGMEDHGFALKTIGDALTLQSHVMELMEKAEVCDDPQEKRNYLSVIVVGGGFSGVEVAGELNDLMRRSRKFFRKINVDDIKVTIVHSREQILPELSPSLGNFAKQRMEKAGVRVLTNATAVHATACGVKLANGEFIWGKTVVCTIGVAVHVLVQKLAAEKTAGRLKTESDMSLPGHPCVWAIGDCAAIINADDNKASPPVAQFAERQGAQAAYNIVRRIKGEETKPFSYRMMGSMCAIGAQDAVGEVSGIRIAGFFAWFVWRGLYLMKLPSLTQKIKVGLEWACDLVFPRTLAHLKADRSRRIGRAYFAAGDHIFKEGSHGSEFFVIERGEAEVRKNREVAGCETKEEVIAILGPGDFFGEGAILDGRPRSASVKARTDLEVIVMGRSIFTEMSIALVPLRDAIAKALKRRTNIWKNLQDVREILEDIPLKSLLEPIEDQAITADCHIAEAIGRINRNRLDFCCVIENEDELVGIVTRTDLLRAIEVAAALPEGSEMTVLVGDIMVKDPIAIHLTDTTSLALMTMREHGFKTLPVVDDEKNRRLKGYIRIENIMDTILQRMLVPEAKETETDPLKKLKATQQITKQVAKILNRG